MELINKIMPIVCKAVVKEHGGYNNLIYKTYSFKNTVRFST